ncbi:acyl-CoA synthetase (NDP forming) [Microvirga flocculans]|uniref:Acyl-CoA synthetase (NDP forming) n=1 Tax=Microvirga flocculans TaxID=217168 RepID=A0A7W6IHV8_9HYPH|nr:acetate--CoA ligase family protein [Microvirga flocculans]MBB4041174.1 acyl-CoA synthetase (NDP forming) [Microvirga flocculans]
MSVPASQGSDWKTALHAPRAVAVIGASSNPQKIGGRTLANLREGGFEGQVYPVNPAGGEMAGWQAYPSLTDVPVPPDMAIIAVPGAEAVEAAIRDCAAASVKTCVVFSAGFRESGEQGHAHEARLVREARSLGLRILGPNSQGSLCARSGLVASFATTFQEYAIEDGPVAIISQSGAMSSVIYGLLREKGIGVRYVHATGNESDISSADLLDVVADDPDISAVLLYLESISDPEKLAAAARKARAAGQLILCVKAGASASGQKAAQSHTGALASDDKVVDAFLSRVGICRVDNLRGLVDIVPLALQRREAGVGGLVLVSNSGAACVLGADLCERLNVPLARLSEATKQTLDRIVPPNGNTDNPIDVTPALLTDPTMLERILGSVAADPAVDSILLNLPGSVRGYDFPRFSRDIERFRAQSGALTLVVTPTSGARVEMASSGAAVFEHDSDALQALSVLRRAQRLPSSPAQQVELEAPKLSGSGFLDEAESLKILERIGIPTVAHRLCSSVEEARSAWEIWGGAVVVKGCSSRFPHKSEYGLVELGCRDAGAVSAAFERITAQMKAHGEHDPRAIVATFSRMRAEAFVGARWDDAFGAVVVVGEGGKYTEARQDVVTLSWPFGQDEVLNALKGLRVASIWAGVRGEPALDLAPLAEIAVRIGSLVDRMQGAIVSIDANPVGLGAPGEACIVLDALVEVAG